MPENGEEYLITDAISGGNQRVSALDLSQLQTEINLNLGPFASLSGNTFAKYRGELYKKLKELIELCKSTYKSHKDLATDKDELVVDLCEVLEEVFSYGLRQQQATVVVTTASLLQNMQEIITGNVSGPNIRSSLETTFWDFCEIHLPKPQKDRFGSLKKVWTKHGKGKSFIRAALNENCLRRYLLLWFKNEDILRQYYTPWSLMVNREVMQELPGLIGQLETVLFTINFDTTELNAPTKFTHSFNHITNGAGSQDEPIIAAPEPINVVKSKQKREIQIKTPSPFDEHLEELNFNPNWKDIRGQQQDYTNCYQEEEVPEDYQINETLTTNDPIEPEMEFLKAPLEEFCIGAAFNQLSIHNQSSSISNDGENEEDKSDSSSLCSKSSSSLPNGFTSKPSSGPPSATSSPSNSSATNATASSSTVSNNEQQLMQQLQDMTEKCAMLETRVAKLTLQNRQLLRKLTTYFKESGIDPNSSLAANYLITIPQATLVKSSKGSSFYTYEIHVTMRHQMEHWSVIRRYRDFYKLHKSLLKTHPIMSTVEFPPKKHFGNMNRAFVEERRQQLQIYLINLVEHIPQVEACKTKNELQKIFPFLRER